MFFGIVALENPTIDQQAGLVVAPKQLVTRSGDAIESTMVNQHKSGKESSGNQTDEHRMRRGSLAGFDQSHNPVLTYELRCLATIDNSVTQMVMVLSDRSVLPASEHCQVITRVRRYLVAAPDFKHDQLALGKLPIAERLKTSTTAIGCSRSEIVLSSPIKESEFRSWPKTISKTKSTGRRIPSSLTQPRLEGKWIGRDLQVYQTHWSGGLKRPTSPVYVTHARRSLPDQLGCLRRRPPVAVIWRSNPELADFTSAAAICVMSCHRPAGLTQVVQRTLGLECESYCSMTSRNPRGQRRLTGTAY
jgi:hypothetical protein